jgi:hypothetical protein
VSYTRRSLAPPQHRHPAIKSRSWPTAFRRIKIIAAILERPVIEKILTHVGLQARAPIEASARWAVPHLARLAASVIRHTPPRAAASVGSGHCSQDGA